MCTSEISNVTEFNPFAIDEDSDYNRNSSKHLEESASNPINPIPFYGHGAHSTPQEVDEFNEDDLINENIQDISRTVEVEATITENNSDIQEEQEDTSNKENKETATSSTAVSSPVLVSIQYYFSINQDEIEIVKQNLDCDSYEFPTGCLVQFYIQATGEDSLIPSFSPCRTRYRERVGRLERRRGTLSQSRNCETGRQLPRSGVRVLIQSGTCLTGVTLLP
ncbi:hypothetical protein RN001_005502 [Aquatica leii]|uniref:Uncharacterized protein n=1 Tax=Aquatica leii TaxID=1421715 RepID=A0AAN7QKD3_9COLE|nr:hypothetical protein RN001_005502 [Aquatica leii]